MSITQIKDFLLFIQDSTDPAIYFSKTTIIFLLLFLCVRHLLIGNVFRMSHRMDRDTHKLIRKEYLKTAWMGWVLSLIGLGIFHLLSFYGPFMLKFLSFEEWLVILSVLILLAILNHLFYFTRAILTVFHKRIEIEKN
jgi:formate hydrogenlyase subunit 3/multisubunit Na+/H+ antiporter MnhD subunit